MPSQPTVAPISRDIFKHDIFKGKVLFCTGGGSGICKMMVEAVMHHGANAAIVGRSLDRLTEAARELTQATGQSCIAAQADVRDPMQLKSAVSKTIENFGHIDFVICGAAGNFLASIDGMSENAFKAVVDIDMLGTFNTIKATLPYIRATRGVYILVSATLHYRGTQYQAHVSAAKAGIDALSAVLAVEEGPRGVRSNVIAPGPIMNTEGLSRLSNQVSGSMSLPLGRIGHGHDIANAAVFLFSDAAAFITGQVLAVDGAWEHIRVSQLPYPDALLDPESVSHMIKPRL